MKFNIFIDENSLLLRKLKCLHVLSFCSLFLGVNKERKSVIRQTTACFCSLFLGVNKELRVDERVGN
jgi:hypothetical protein